MRAPAYDRSVAMARDVFRSFGRWIQHRLRSVWHDDETIDSHDPREPKWRRPRLPTKSVDEYERRQRQR